jgi:G:T-mismatch repair DNA endonuclease (very short patch repair protein)
MPDVFTKSKRSEVMSRIRGRGNKDTELALIRVFRAQRITGWRRHQRESAQINVQRKHRKNRSATVLKASRSSIRAAAAGR